MKFLYPLAKRFIAGHSFDSAKPKIDAGEAKAIKEAAVNLHRTTYNSVKTTGLWGHSIEDADIEKAAP